MRNVPIIWSIFPNTQRRGNCWRRNILPIETIAGDERMIGNIIIKSQEFGDIVGYENHSGQTFLDKTAKPLGQVIKGAGNNMTDANEGVRYNNIIATYLHGPILPKNPQIADFLIGEASLKATRRKRRFGAGKN
ncbi:hypothetical protein [Candidatus Minimicrobia naudis]